MAGGCVEATCISVNPHLRYIDAPGYVSVREIRSLDHARHMVPHHIGREYDTMVQVSLKKMACLAGLLTLVLLVGRIEMYETDETFRNGMADVCSITRPTVEEVMEEFAQIPLIDGKTFWELENELEWV